MQKPKFFLSVLAFILLSYLFVAVIPVQAATAWSASGSLLYYMNGAVAINTTSPMWGKFAIKAGSQQDFMDLFTGDNSNFRIQNPDNARIELQVYDATSNTTHWKVLSILRNGDISMGMNGDPVSLNLNGTLKAKEIIVTNQGWADYVFDENYRLMPLSEVAAYIAENKHLPDVASSTEIADKGISVGDIQKSQMQKIEELTLYTIRQEEEINDLKAAVRTLQAREE